MAEPADKNIRVLLLCCDGLFQRDLARALHERYHLTGIVKLVDPAVRGSLMQRFRRYLNPIRAIRHVLARAHQRGAHRAAFPLLAELFYRDGESPAYPTGVPALEVANINDAAAVDFVREHSPDIVCVNGTNLLRKPMLDLAAGIPHGIINLHTGLSPYTRGGNCNLYALRDGHPEWVGVTVHYIDPGIDSGELIRTAQVPMHADDLFDHIDVRTFRLGNDLLVDSVAEVVGGRAMRIRQWEPGKLYLKRTGYVYEPWHWYQVNRMLRGGLVRRYLAHRAEADAAIRLVGGGP